MWWLRVQEVWLKIRNIITPRHVEDPLLKNAGFGWGWLVLLGVEFSSLSKLIDAFSERSGVPGPRGEAFLTFQLVCMPIIILVYFLIRKKLIEKRKYGKRIWVNSLEAGAGAILVYMALIFLGALSVRMLIS